MRVSHETIYRSLFIQARGVLKRELTQHLRRPRTVRGARRRGPGSMPDGISISERPAQVEDRAVPGIGKATSCVATRPRRSQLWSSVTPAS